MATDLKRLHILIADDDDDDSLLFEDALEDLKANTQLSVVANGSELMELLGKSASLSLPDIVFLDLNMPFKNGIECLIEIRKDLALSHLPVILFSTSAQEEAVQLAYDNGANLYFKKPDAFLKFKQILDSILNTDWRNCQRPARDEFLIVD